MNNIDPLAAFLPPVQQWFRNALGEPTAAQRQGWPSIAAGQHTLILAPTGSGKTLAAFLACLDGLWRQSSAPAGVQVLYISPLKALNNDIHRNLQVPLAGVQETARALDYSLPTIDVGLRTGDTPPAERQRLLRRPPHVLITTPESLHLLLTSRGRETLRTVTHCIVDEIHALCSNKRGVFLAVLLERLVELTGKPFVRIGLSATQRPLEEIARYLGGSEQTPDGPEPRPVTVIDAGLRKDLDLRVLSPVEQFGYLPERSIWPSIYRLLADEIRRHRSTLVFANNRRTVERITANLNALEEEAGGTKPLARAHHGSVALDVRHATEQALKEGRLPAVVATASLELGIDMGAVDLVCQVESPGSVARGLQRVGRAGHLVGRQSKGRLIAKTPADLLEQAVLAHEMMAGRVEEIRVPTGCLDVLAQQVVAMTAMEVWDVPHLFGLLRRAYPYRDLTPAAFEAVLEMVSGRYRFGQDENPRLAPAALQPRVSWDRIHNRLEPLPGTRHLALVNGGTIPDTGQYATYTMDGARIGDLDEEFIYERRIGDTFLLGTNAWRLERIDVDRVFVTPAEGAPAMVPFWRGEQGGRSYDLGLAIGRFLRELTSRLDAPECTTWLERDYLLDRPAAQELRAYVRRQWLATGQVPSDRTILIEASRDPLGDWQVFILTPFGSRLHLALRLALEAQLSKRLGYRPQCLHHSEGILIRLSDSETPPLDLFADLTAETVEDLVLQELADSALFSLRFRQNASRALLLPCAQPGKRAPLWLQRLRGRDLLQIARRHPDFPIILETFRECLNDHLDVPHLQELLRHIASGEIAVVTRRAESPSPFATGLLFAYTAAFMYDYDRAQGNTGQPAELDRRLLEQLLRPEENAGLLDTRAVHQVERRLRGTGQPPRSASEMAEWLRRLGDVTADELEGPMQNFIEELQADGRVARIELPRCPRPVRFVLTEHVELYGRAFGLDGWTVAPAEQQTAAITILERFLATHALVALPDILSRYPFEPTWAERQLEDWTRRGLTVRLAPAGDGAVQWSVPDNLQQVQRTGLAMLRREVITCPPEQFAHFVLHWQRIVGRGDDVDAVGDVLTRLEGAALPAELWEQTVFPGRVADYEPHWLDNWLTSGEWTWTCSGTEDSGAGNVAFWSRTSLPTVPPPTNLSGLTTEMDQVVACLRQRGASFVTDLARETNVAPSAVRSALWGLLRRRLVTNDHFEVVRRGQAVVPSVSDSPANGRGLRHLTRAARRPGMGRSAEGRWSLIPWGAPETERAAIAAAGRLLNRYGIAARELALMDSEMPPWRILYEVLSRMELAGEIRRGYFVEGLSGAQFALPEAARQLQDLALPSTALAPVTLLHSLDPANLYGSGAAFDIPLLDGGTRPLLRRAGNWLVLRAGRPILLVEGQGRKLTALASASRDDVSAAVACLPEIVRRDRSRAGRRKLTVEEWNGMPVTASNGRPILEAAGFVRDYQAFTLYPSWR